MLMDLYDIFSIFYRKMLWKSVLFFGAPQRGALCVMLLLGSCQEVPKKHAKGSGTPWDPAVRHGKMNFA